MGSLGERIKEAANKLGGLDKLAARLTGVSRRTLGDYVSGKSEPRISTVIEIAEATETDLNWLLREKGGPVGSLADLGGPGFVALPRLDVRASAGDGRLAVLDDPEGTVVAFRQDWLRRLGVAPRNAMIIMAEGDSMQPTIRHGHLVLIDKSIDRVVDDGIYVLVYAGMVKLKRVQVMLSGVVLLKSDNPAYQTEEIKVHELPELIIEGRVRWAGGAL